MTWFGAWASQGSGSAPPVDGTVINFLTGSYTVNGVTVTAADVVANPELITADGLIITEDVVNIIGDLLTLLLTANYTAVLAWDHLDYTGNIVPLALIDPDTSDDGLVVKRQSSGEFMNVSDFSGAHFRGAVDSSAVGDNGHKVAVTRTDAKLVFSVDGRDNVTYAGDPDTFAIAPTSASFGGLPGGFTFAEVRIQSLTVYAAQDDSLLPALSA